MESVSEHRAGAAVNTGGGALSVEERMPATILSMFILPF